MNLCWYILSRGLYRNINTPSSKGHHNRENYKDSDDMDFKENKAKDICEKWVKVLIPYDLGSFDSSRVDNKTNSSVNKFIICCSFRYFLTSISSSCFPHISDKDSTRENMCFDLGKNSELIKIVRGLRNVKLIKTNAYSFSTCDYVCFCVNHFT